MGCAGLSRGNQRADFGSSRSLATRLLPFQNQKKFRTETHGVHRENTEKCLETLNFKGHRGVTSGLTSEAHEVSRYAFCFLTCRERHIKKGYRAVAKRRGAYAAMRAFPGFPERQAGWKPAPLREEALTPRCLFSLCSPCPLCEPLFFILERTPGYRAVAKRRGAYAAMGCSLRVLRALCAKLSFLIFHSQKTKLPLFISV